MKNRETVIRNRITAALVSPQVVENLYKAVDDELRIISEAIVDAVRQIHNPGDESVLAPGKWCVADGDEWPCKTIRACARALVEWRDNA